MKKSNLMHGKMAVAKKLQLVQEQAHRVQQIVPNLNHKLSVTQGKLETSLFSESLLKQQVNVLRKKDAAGQAQLRLVYNTLNHKDEQIRQMRGSIDRLVSDRTALEEGLTVAEEDTVRLHSRLSKQYSVAGGLRREVENAKKQAIFNLVLGTMGWIILAVTVATYVGR